METKTAVKVEQAPSDDCLPCRIITGSSAIGIAAYIIAQSKKRRKTEGLIMQLLAAGFLGVGLARLFNLYPFRRNK